MSSRKWVKISDIEPVKWGAGEPSQKSLHSLEHGHDSFDYCLNKHSDPVTLSGSKPYSITDGRHRIHLARKKGIKEVYARLL